MSVAALFILLKKAWESHKGVSNSGTEEFQKWVEQQSKDSIQFHYWYQAISLQTTLLMLVRSIREANFKMYLDVLTQICPWMFALDHVHYSRWLPVFLKTLKDLEVRHPQVHKEFISGKFVTQKSNKPFSSLSDDHVHEQCNRNVKHDGGAVGLMNNPTALLKWMIAGPEISRMVLCLAWG